MEYYSEVAICMAFENEEKRDAFWELLRKDGMSDVIKYSDKDYDAPWIRYHNDHIKWCESNPDRQVFEGEDGIFNLVIKNGGAWQFMRLGQDPCDFEGKAVGNTDVAPDAFRLVREIEWNIS